MVHAKRAPYGVEGSLRNRLLYGLRGIFTVQTARAEPPQN